MFAFIRNDGVSNKCLAARVGIFAKRERNNSKNGKKKTYNSRCSLVVTDPTTNLPINSLSMGEQTGSRILCYLWSYVPITEQG